MQFRNILFTTDFSDSAAFALDYAVDLCQRYEAKLHIVHVIEPIVAPVDFAWGSYNYPDIEKQVQGYADDRMAELTGQKLPSGLKAEAQILVGKPWREIVRVARDEGMDLIVLATHGLSGLSHAIYGSTAEKVIRKSTTPVLVVRHPDVLFEMP